MHWVTLIPNGKACGMGGARAREAVGPAGTDLRAAAAKAAGRFTKLKLRGDSGTYFIGKGSGDCSGDLRVILY